MIPKVLVNPFCFKYPCPWVSTMMGTMTPRKSNLAVFFCLNSHESELGLDFIRCFVFAPRIHKILPSCQMSLILMSGNTCNRLDGFG